MLGLVLHRHGHLCDDSSLIVRFWNAFFIIIIINIIIIISFVTTTTTTIKEVPDV